MSAGKQDAILQDDFLKSRFYLITGADQLAGIARGHRKPRVCGGSLDKMLPDAGQVIGQPQNADAGFAHIGAVNCTADSDLVVVAACFFQ